MSSGGFLYNKILAKSLQNLNLDTLQKFNVLAGLSNTRTYGKRLKYSQDKTLPRAIQRRQDCRINIWLMCFLVLIADKIAILVVCPNFHTQVRHQLWRVDASGSDEGEEKWQKFFAQSAVQRLDWNNWLVG